jgi:gliding motility-associated-like protein
MFLRYILLVAFFFICNAGLAQEICNNGKDDDGDGLTDLQDPDCQCRFTVTDNLLLNGSFESYKHCPIAYTYSVNHDIADYWEYGTYTNISEVSFYHNINCSYDWAQVMLHMPPEFPLPDGNGLISILHNAYIDPIPENEMTKSYVGQCLQAPLTPGTEYTLSFYAGRFRSWDDRVGKIYPFSVAIFGNADCSAVPFGKPNVLGNGCPTDYPGWVLLGKTTVTSDGEWVQSKINFTVPFAINVIEIGPDCSILPPIVSLADSTTFFDYHNYYLDDLHLLPTKNFPFEYIHPQTGSACSGNGLAVLQAPPFPNATYQWYKDSVAIAGATNITYQLPLLTKNAYYNVVVTTPGKCVITEPFLAVANGLNNVNIPADTILCSDSSIILAPAMDGILYTVNGTERTDVIIDQPGEYNIVVTDTYNCQKTFNVKVVEQKCSDCEILLPNAFTPNGDGLNDIFKARSFCVIADFNIQIFDRWGQKIFESHNHNTGWDGTYSGKKIQSGVFVYFISYKTSSHITKIAKGIITLIR